MNRKERRAKERARVEFVQRMQQGKLQKRLVVKHEVRLPDESALRLVAAWQAKKCHLIKNYTIKVRLAEFDSVDVTGVPQVRV